MHRHKIPSKYTLLCCYRDTKLTVMLLVLFKILVIMSHAYQWFVSVTVSNKALNIAGEDC